MALLRQQIKHRHGFTLIEAIAAIVIISVAVAATSRVIFAATNAMVSSSVRSKASAELSTALERASTVLRAIPIKAATATIEPSITSVSSTSIAWSTASSLALSGTSLRLTPDTGTATTLLENVTSFSVSCFDTQGNALSANLAGSQCEAIHSVQLSITTTRFGISETLRTRISLRTLMKGVAQ